MKNVIGKENRLILWAMVALASSGAGFPEAHAGREGHGGVAVVCRDSAGKISSTELLDFFEAPKHEIVITPKSGASVQDYLAGAVERLKKDTDFWFARAMEQQFDLIQKRFKLLPEGVGLELLEDALPVLRKKGCRYEQLANFDENGIIWIDAEIYAALDELARAGFIAHEAIYFKFRNYADAKDSVKARKVNALLFADELMRSTFRREAIAIRLSCGLQGTLQERVADCSESFGSKASKMITRIEPNRWDFQRYEWNLVARNPFGYTLWQEPKTARVWGAFTRGEIRLEHASYECDHDAADYFGKEIVQMGLGFPKFDLPSKEEVTVADTRGLARMFGQAVAKSSMSFWTRTKTSSSTAWVYQADDVSGGDENTSRPGEIEFDTSNVGKNHASLCVTDWK